MLPLTEVKLASETTHTSLRTIALVDTGATHTAISRDTARQLTLDLSKLPTRTVETADGKTTTAFVVTNLLLSFSPSVTYRTSALVLDSPPHHIIIGNNIIIQNHININIKEEALSHTQRGNAMTPITTGKHAAPLTATLKPRIGQLVKPGERVEINARYDDKHASAWTRTNTFKYTTMMIEANDITLPHGLQLETEAALTHARTPLMFLVNTSPHNIRLRSDIRITCTLQRITHEDGPLICAMTNRHQPDHQHPRAADGSPARSMYEDIGLPELDAHRIPRQPPQGWVDHGPPPLLQPYHHLWPYLPWFEKTRLRKNPHTLDPLTPTDMANVHKGIGTAIDPNECDTEEANMLTIIGLANADRLHEEPKDKPVRFIRGSQFNIYLSDDIPTRAASRPLAKLEQHFMRYQQRKMLGQTIWAPSVSEYCSPIHLVRKKLPADVDLNSDPATVDPSIPVEQWFRCVHDYRPLNKKTIIPKHPMPRIMDVINEVMLGDRVSSIDVADAFYRIKLNPEHAHRTAFMGVDYHLEYRAAPQGVSGIAQGLAAIMTDTLCASTGRTGDGKRTGIRWFQDDVSPYGDGAWAHACALITTFRRFRWRDLRVSLRKLKLAKRRVRVLGFDVDLTNKTITPDREKVAAILDLHPPRNTTELRRFLGLVNFYSRFIPNHATTIAPLNDILTGRRSHRRRPIHLNDDAQAAFDTTKRAIANAITHAPDLNRPFTIRTDSCTTGRGHGAVLLQAPAHNPNDLHPVAFYSRVATLSERKMPPAVFELTAMAYAVRHWRHYLASGRRHTFKTDHQSLTNVFEWTHSNPAIIRRIAEMVQTCSFTIEYEPGTKIIDSDTLSQQLRLQDLLIDDFHEHTPEPRWLDVQRQVQESFDVAGRDEHLKSRDHSCCSLFPHDHTPNDSNDDDDDHHLQDDHGIEDNSTPQTTPYRPLIGKSFQDNEGRLCHVADIAATDDGDVIAKIALTNPSQPPKYFWADADRIDEMIAVYESKDLPTTLQQWATAQRDDPEIERLRQHILSTTQNMHPSISTLEERQHR